jgi:predicted GIY-YIG superfamily endonuclease
MAFFCYCLQRDDGRQTYIGATVDPDRRLKQHQGELSGGARATQGKVWRRVCLVGGFPSWNDALKFEWRWKRFGRKFRNWEKGLEALMALDKPTESAVPYVDYPEGMPIVHISEPIHAILSDFKD